LKRALSLARLTHLHDLASEALVILSSERVERYVRARAVKEIRKLAGHLQDREKALVLDELDSPRYVLKPLTASEVIEMNATAARAINRVASAFDAIGDEILQVAE
jgi:hypothetical protein